MSFVLHFQPTGYPLEEPFCPPSLAISPSQAARQVAQYQALRTVVPQYAHRFALEARHVFETSTVDADTIQLVVEDVHGIKQHSTVVQESLYTVITAFRSIQELDKQPAVPPGSYPSDQCLRQREQVKTALFTRAVDRFLFPDNQLQTGGCYHQLPSRPGATKPEAPDLTVMALHDNVPTRAVVVADGKIEDMAHAEIESCMYAVTSLQQVQCNTVLLGLPFT